MADGATLLWFHAFDRDAPGAIADVLREGPGPNPDPATRTRANEIILGIRGPCVYAYLGRTSEAFGKRAVALAQGALTGVVSPFDTGGLVRYIRPVCEWDNEMKKQFLGGHTWPTEKLPELLSQYPGSSHHLYLDGACPEAVGPHQCLPVGDVTAVIWKGAGNGWQAWTWEGRSTARLQVRENLVAWSCHPDEFADLLVTLAQTRPDEQTRQAGVIEMISKYRRGGVSSLVAELRAVQEATNA